MDNGLKICALVLDIDGVLTDGKVAVDLQGRETKSYAYRDVDAIFQARREGLLIALVTGEESPMVDLLARRVAVKEVISGAKEKGVALEEMSARLQVPLSEICYVGDADRDAPALASVGLGLAPADASLKAKQAATRVLSAGGGHGAVAEAVGLILAIHRRHTSRTSEASTDSLERMHSDRPAVRDKLAEILRESASVKQAAANILSDEMATAAEWICAALRSEHKLLIFGNGGSAADAQHMAGEFVGRFNREREAWAAIALTTDSTVLTALGNDYGFETVFARQVDAMAKPGDIVIALSTSGNSPNVVRGVLAATTRGVQTIAFTGRQGGHLAEICDLAFRVPSEATPRIQECHITIIHAICEVVESVLTEGGEHATR